MTFSVYGLLFTFLELVNLSKKCFLAFSIKRPSFNLLDLIP